MNEKITILGKSNIFIGLNLLNKLSEILNLKNYSNIVVVTDLVISKYWLKPLKKSLPITCQEIIVPNGEQAKNVDIIQKIWLQMLKAKCDRKSLVINLGGGVIGDIGGFAASTYMRGVDFVNIPTTLLAQVDASVGGKVGIDFVGIKNLIGTFNQPKTVIIDINTLSSLPEREFLSGFAEIIKNGAIKDKKYFDKVISKHPLKFTQDELIDIIFFSIQIKAGIVENDETESGDRKLLNFGHTIGHAIESLSLQTSAPLLHGEAISIGMLAEARISYLQKMLSLSEVKQIEQALIQTDLPITVSGIKIENIIAKMQSDKKNEKGKILFTLLQNIGKAVINQTVPASIIKQVLKQTLK